MDPDEKDEVALAGEQESLPTPTYREWLDERAKVVFDHWGFHIARGALELIKYLTTREQQIMNLLERKGILQPEEVSEYFGEEAYAEQRIKGFAQLRKLCLYAASRGQLITPTGKPIDPDSVLVILDDIMDFNNTGWDGKALEALDDVCKVLELRKHYDDEVARIANENRARKEAGEIRAEQAELERRRQEERERRIGIYLSQCKLAGKEPPSDDDMDMMRNGTKPIPKGPA